RFSRDWSSDVCSSDLSRFDDTGQFVYSVRDRTVVAAASSGATVGIWTGTVPIWPTPRGVTAVYGEPAALVEDGGCVGTTVYHPECGRASWRARACAAA